MLMTTLAAGALTLRSFTAVHGLAAFQTQDSINSGNSQMLMIFIGIAAFALLAQALVMIVAGIGALKALKEIKVHVEELRGKAMPLIATAHGLVTDLTPEIKQITTKVHEISVKIEQITGHVEEISGVAKDTVHEFAPTLSEANETLKDVNRMSREQLQRVDAMITGALHTTGEMGAALRHGITAPGREIAHLANGAKAILSSFVDGTRSSMDTVVNDTKSSVETLVHGTRGTVESLLHGVKGLTASLFAAKSKAAPYRPAAYRSNPAVPNHPAATEFSERPKRPMEF